MPFILQSHEIHYLETYTQYLVSLQVFNPEGPGPSTTVLVMTDEGGKLCLCIMITWNVHPIVHLTFSNVIIIIFAKGMSHIIFHLNLRLEQPNLIFVARLDLVLSTYLQAYIVQLIRSIKAKIKCFVSQQC